MPSILLHGLAMNTTMALERLTYLKKVAVELPPANHLVEISTCVMIRFWVMLSRSKTKLLVTKRLFSILWNDGPA